MFEVKKLYSFEVYPATIIGQDFKNVRLLGEVQFDMATPYGDVYAQHVASIGFLPAGTIQDPRALVYLVFEFATGERRAIAKVWIKEDTVVGGGTATLIASIPDSGPEDADRLRDILGQAGFKNFKVGLE